MSTEHCTECDAPINVREDVDCYDKGEPLCARCRGVPLWKRLIDRDNLRGVRVLTRAAYNMEVWRRIAACIKEDGSFDDLVDPEPMGDCLIVEPAMPPAGITTALVLPGPRFRVKLGDCFTGFDRREDAEAFIVAARIAASA